MPDPLAGLLGIVQAMLGGQTYQGTMGRSYPAVFDPSLGGAEAQAPLFGRTNLLGAPIPIRYGAGYEPGNAPIGVQRHEVGHTEIPANRSLENIPPWAIQWASQSAQNPQTGMWPGPNEPAYGTGGSYAAFESPDQIGQPQNLSQGELVANLYGLGLFDPLTGVGPSEEDTSTEFTPQPPSPTVPPSWIANSMPPEMSPPTAPQVLNEWGEQNPDGTVTVFQEYDDGTWGPVRTESFAANQGQV